MKDGLKMVIAGGVAVALVTAFGLHAEQLAKLPKPTGQALSGVLGTAETGTPNAA
jgi:hypothetical protein